MRLESGKYLYDIQQAARLLAEFTHGRSFSDYCTNAMLRSAVERQFEVIGEALARLAPLDPRLANQISEHARIAWRAEATSAMRAAWNTGSFTSRRNWPTGSTHGASG